MPPNTSAAIVNGKTVPRERRTCAIGTSGRPPVNHASLNEKALPKMGEAQGQIKVLCVPSRLISQEILRPRRYLMSNNFRMAGAGTPERITAARRSLVSGCNSSGAC